MTDDYERKNDNLVIELKQEFKDFTERYERDQESSKEWRESHDQSAIRFRREMADEIRELKEFVSHARWSWKLLLGFGATLTAVIKAYDAFKEHWK